MPRVGGFSPRRSDGRFPSREVCSQNCIPITQILYHALLYDTVIEELPGTARRASTKTLRHINRLFRYCFRQAQIFAGSDVVPSPQILESIFVASLYIPHA